MKTFSGKKNIQEQFPDLLFDESRFSSGIPEKLYFPRTQSDVIEITLEALSSRKPITLIGAQTGITGSGVPIDDCIAVSFSEMNAIERVDWTDPLSPVLYCQPGVTLSAIALFLQNPSASTEGTALLEPGAWLYPPDPTEMSAQLGGTAATNASGARSFFFGPTRKHIAALSLVFADGQALPLKRGDAAESNGIITLADARGGIFPVKRPDYESMALKNAAGYYSKKNMDLIDLFIGSEGTLAIFTEIGIALTKAQRSMGGLSFFPSRLAAFNFAEFLRGRSDVAAIEFFDENALILSRHATAPDGRKLPPYPVVARAAVYWEYLETSAPFEERMDAWEKALVECGSTLDSTWSGFDKKETALLKWFRHSVPEMINAVVADYKRECPDIRKISTDAALPGRFFTQTTEQCVDMVEKSKLHYVLFGHLGDFHLHCNLLPRTQAELTVALEVYENIMELVIARQGTVSAEHGIGKMKRAYLARQYGPAALMEMVRLKSHFDPLWLLNRGNLFDRLPQHIL